MLLSRDNATRQGQSQPSKTHLSPGRLSSMSDPINSSRRVAAVGKNMGFISQRRALE